MPGNTFGKILRLTTFGESHSECIGGVLDGLPSQIKIDNELLAHDMQRRRPGKSSFESPRKEADEVRFLSGICDNKTLGTPIGFIINNIDTKSKDYAALKDVYRPSHADYTYHKKYGIRDYRGGGRASARETAARVVGGALAKMFLKESKVRITAFISQIGPIALKQPYYQHCPSVEASPPLFCPNIKTSHEIEDYLKVVEKEGDTVGGTITCVVSCLPPGLGEPVFDKLQARLAYAMMSIPAAKGFAYGTGFEAASMKGSDHNDAFKVVKNKITTSTNFSGGIQGGISNGQDIYFDVAFKPVSSIKKRQVTIDVEGRQKVVSIKGRHDVCPVPRAVPIVEAMTALVIADNMLLQKRFL